jgi:hypothetical protein
MFNGTNGYSLSDIAAASGGNRNNDGMFGNDGWWIILLFMFTGWGRNGFGGGFGGGGNDGLPCATQADVRAAVDQQTLISKLDQQTYGLADSTYALNNSITNGFHGVDTAICNLGYNIQAGTNGISHQISDCCCATQRAIEGGFAELNYNLATQACDTRRAISDSTRDLLENQNNGIRSILDFLTQDKIATLTAENQSLKFAASQSAQNAYLVNQLRDPCPIPAYMVPNPNCCYGSYGYPRGCGCDNFCG